MNNNRLTGAAEAILFAAAEPLEAARIAAVLECTVQETEELLKDYSDMLDKRGSGICLLKLDTKYQLCSRKEYVEEIRAVLDIKRNTPLSQAAFEVLAIVAYNQPITKSFIEQVRGVDCSGVVSTLLQRGLIEEKGRLELPGRPLVYGTTPDFLRCFSLVTLEDLPELPRSDSDILMEGIEPDLEQITFEAADDSPEQAQHKEAAEATSE